LMEEHDHDQQTLFNRKPLKRLAEIKSLIEKDVDFNERRVPTSHPGNLKHALWIVADCAADLRLQGALDKRSPNKCPKKMLNLARMYPAMLTVFKYLTKDGKFKPLDVFVVKEKKAIVSLQRRGYALFEDQKSAEKYLEYCLLRLAEPERHRGNFEIRRAKITLHDGLVFLKGKDSHVSSTPSRPGVRKISTNKQRKRNAD
jgi:hypothetical protein